MQFAIVDLIKPHHNMNLHNLCRTCFSYSNIQGRAIKPTSEGLQRYGAVDLQKADIFRYQSNVHIALLQQDRKTVLTFVATAVKLISCTMMLLNFI